MNSFMLRSFESADKPKCLLEFKAEIKDSFVTEGCKQNSHLKTTHYGAAQVSPNQKGYQSLKKANKSECKSRFLLNTCKGK